MLLGVGWGDGRGVGLAGGQGAVGAGAVLVKRLGDGEGILLLQRGQHDHQGVDGGFRGGGGGQILFVELVLPALHGARLQGQHRLLRVGGEGERLALLAVRLVAPEIGAADVVARGRRDEQVFLQQIPQDVSAGVPAHGRVVGVGRLGVGAADGDGAGAAAQLLGLFLGAEGNAAALVVGVGQAELVDQRFVAGERDVHVVRQGHAAGELEHKDQHQQKAQHRAHVLLHGNHLKMKRLSVLTSVRIVLRLTRGDGLDLCCRINGWGPACPGPRSARRSIRRSRWRG